MTEESYTDDADVSQLEQRIDELEATIRQMLPSRREAIGMGVAGLAGASLMSGTASAGSAQVGTIGDNSNLVDLVAEDVTITDTLNTASLSGAAADEALLSDGSGNLTFGSVGGVEEVSTFGDLPAIDPPQLAYVVDEEEYYHSSPITGTAFDISSASVSTSISTQDSIPEDIAWNDDGSRLYEVGSGSDKIYQSTLSTPFDISTASFATSINSQDSIPGGIAWNDDGTRLYESAGDTIYQSTVSTPFEISSASFSTSINTNNNEADANGLAFSNDGTRMVVAIVSPNIIQQYDLSTPFDISTAVFDTDIPGQDDMEGIAWNDDGSRLYEVGQADNIYQSTLSTPFDITTASFSTSINAQDISTSGIAWNNDGSRLYEVDSSSAEIYQYTVTTGGWEAF